MSLADNYVKNWWNLPISNPKSDLHNINVRIKSDENSLRFTLVTVLNKNTDVSLADYFVKNWQILPISNSKAYLHDINAKVGPS